MNDKKYVLYKDNITLPMEKGYGYVKRYGKPGINVINEQISEFFPEELATFETEEEAKKELAKYESSFSYGRDYHGFDYAEFDLYYYEEQDLEGILDGGIETADGDKLFYIAYYMNLKDSIDYDKTLEVVEELEEDIEWKKQNGWTADDIENDIRFLQGLKDDIQEIEERYNREREADFDKDNSDEMEL